MICFPEVQMKAQAELDHVVSGRLPDFSDMDDLPYLSAIVKEVIRWVLASEDENDPILKTTLSFIRWQPITPTGTFT